MGAILNWLKGKKAYIIMISAIIAAIAGYASETLTMVQMIEAIMAALGLGTLRAGISKIGK